MSNAAVGVFDSGVGGLSVLGEIRALLPHESLLYVADSGHVPYGDKSAEFICARSLTIAEFLLGQGAKALVLACNTATAAAISELRSADPLRVQRALTELGYDPAAAQRQLERVFAVIGARQLLLGSLVRDTDGLRLTLSLWGRSQDEAEWTQTTPAVT